MNDPLRVAFITHYAQLYGANRSLLDLVTELKRTRAVDPLIVLPMEGDLAEVLTKAEIPYRIVPFEPWVTRRLYMGGPHHRLLQWWRARQHARSKMRMQQGAARALAKVLKEHRIQLVHINSSVIGVGHLAASEVDLPYVWHIRELLFRHYEHRPDAGFTAFRHALSGAARVIAISEAVRKELLPIVRDRQRLIMIPNGMLDGSIGPRSDMHHPITFAMVGFIDRNKAQLEGLKAFHRCLSEGCDAHLAIIGSGHDAALRAYAHEHDLGSKVTFTGFLKDTRSIYSKFDVLVSCSRHEAFGRVVVEAMAHGIPVIGHRSGATTELILHGTTGYLYQHPDELPGLLTAFARDPEKVRTMGKAAQDLLGDRFSIAGRSADIAKLYNDILRPQ